MPQVQKRGGARRPIFLRLAKMLLIFYPPNPCFLLKLSKPSEKHIKKSLFIIDNYMIIANNYMQLIQEKGKYNE